MRNRLAGGATRVNADDVRAGPGGTTSCWPVRYYQVADPRVAELVMLARSLAADNAAVLGACVRIPPARTIDETEEATV
jgi:hypothetical protein